MRRRSAIEAVIGHYKTDGHLGRNFLKGRCGDQINAVFTFAILAYNLIRIPKLLNEAAAT